MNKYYCPYCNPKYQFNIERNESLICGLCGEALKRKPIIQIKQLISLLLVLIFCLPFTLIIIHLFNNTDEQDQKLLQANIKVLEIFKIQPLHK